jgi:hypothetical protein
MEYKKNLPLALVLNIDKLLNGIREYCKSYSTTIEYKEGHEGDIIRIYDLDPKSTFYFYVSNPRIERGTPHYTIIYTPADEFNLNQGKLDHTSEGVINALGTWITWIRKYDAAIISPEERFLKFYEKELYTKFDIVDEDADINPFELPKQVAISRFLNKTSKILIENDIAEDDEIFIEVTNLDQNQQTLTKRAVIKKLSLILAKIRLRSIPVFKFVAKTFVKELINQGISAGIKYLTNPQ